MTDSRVTFRLGPVPAAMAAAWVANARLLVEAVRVHRGQISIDVHESMLDVLELVLDIWDGCAARSDPFVWSTETDANQVLYLAREWLEIGSLTADELDQIGCVWAPEWTRPFADALATGVVEALRAVGEGGEPLLARLLGEPS